MYHNFLTARFVPFSAYEIIFFRAVLVCRSSFRELQGTRKCCSPHRREKGSATTRTEFRGRHVRQKFIWVCTCAPPSFACMCQGKEAERRKQLKTQSCEAASRETATTQGRWCLPRRRAWKEPFWQQDANCETRRGTNALCVHLACCAVLRLLLLSGVWRRSVKKSKGTMLHAGCCCCAVALLVVCQALRTRRRH